MGNFAITWWNASGAYRKVETVFNPDKKGKPTTKSRAVEILLRPDGSLVAVGDDVNPGSRLAFARYNSATGALLTKKQHTLEFEPRGATLQGNSILVVGKLLTTNQMAVVRMDLNGNLDPAWGTDGMLVFPVGSESHAEAATIDGTGRIVIAGSAVFADREAVVVRLNADGSPDLTFHQHGYVNTDLGGTDDVYTAVNLRANGLIVATGYTSYHDGGYQKSASPHRNTLATVPWTPPTSASAEPPSSRSASRPPATTPRSRRTVESCSSATSEPSSRCRPASPTSTSGPSSST